MVYWEEEGREREREREEKGMKRGEKKINASHLDLLAPQQVKTGTGPNLLN